MKLHQAPTALLALLLALAVAGPARAAPPREAAPRARTVAAVHLVATGLHANQVEPLARGVASEVASVAVFTTCWLALASDDTCVDVASRARRALSR